MTGGTDQRGTAPQGAGRRRWLMPLLVVSLALNLLVAGLVGGAMLRGRVDPAHAIGADGAFGTWSRAFSDEDGAALRAALRAERGTLRSNWRAEGQDRAAFVAALRADPPDLDRLAAIMARMGARATDRTTLAHRLLMARIADMSPAARRDFADRLEAAFHRPHHPDGRPPRAP
jgi:uncharacterized membrane protein